MEMALGLPALAAGLGIGFILGLTGMGGGALMLPFLLWVLRLSPVVAVGTDLVFTTVTRLVGAVQHRRQKTVWLRPVFYLALGSLPGAWLGAWWVVHRAASDNRWLEVGLPRLIGLMLMLVGGITLGRSLGWLHAPDLKKERWPSARAAWFIGFGGGLAVGTTSVGGGTLIAAVFLLFYAVPPQHLVGLDVLHGALLSGAAMLPYIWKGQIAWAVLPWLWLGALPGVWLGSRLVARLPARKVHLALGILVLLAGLRLLWP